MIMWRRLQSSECLLKLYSGLSITNLNQNKVKLIHNCVSKYKWFGGTQNFYKHCSKSNFSTINTAETFNEPNISEICQGDPELENKLKILILETDVMRQEGKSVPEQLKDFQWGELLKLQSRSARKKYLQYLFKTEKSKENDKLKKEQKKISRLEFIEKKATEVEEDDGHIKYGLQDNNIYLRMYDTTINQLYNNRLVQAMQFGQKIVVDCSYDEFMSPREAKNCAKQLMLLFAENRAHDEPFDLHYCNVNKTSDTISGLHRYINTLYEPWFPLNVHENNYLDHFPKENLVYLTPHCREELTEFDHDAVYIIGAMVDKMNNEPLSLAKAKANNLKMAKLPLDKYLQWGAGSGKSLTLNQMISILLDIKKTGNWETALRHVPRRKLGDYHTDSAIMRSPSRLTYTTPRYNTSSSVPSDKRTVSEGFVEGYKQTQGRNDFKNFNKPSSNLSFKSKGPSFSFANRKKSFQTE